MKRLVLSGPGARIGVCSEPSRMNNGYLNGKMTCRSQTGHPKVVCDHRSNHPNHLGGLGTVGGTRLKSLHPHFIHWNMEYPHSRSTQTALPARFGRHSMRQPVASLCNPMHLFVKNAVIKVNSVASRDSYRCVVCASVGRRGL